MTTRTATTRGGAKVVGRIRNEDNFSLQLQTLEGAFHFVNKSDLEGLEYNPQPLMPSNYSSTLDSAELNDVYFSNRSDGLKLSPLGLGMLATAWV